jgi:hypothetical protein
MRPQSPDLSRCRSRARPWRREPRLVPSRARSKRVESVSDKDADAWRLFANLLAGAFNGVHGIGQMAHSSPTSWLHCGPWKYLRATRPPLHDVGGMPATAFLLEKPSRALARLPVPAPGQKQPANAAAAPRRSEQRDLARSDGRAPRRAENYFDVLDFGAQFSK